MRRLSSFFVFIWAGAGCLAFNLSANAACTVQPGESVIYKTASGLRHCPDGENWLPVTVTDTSTCPAGFTRIGTLGCMQTNENPAAPWPAANQNCFTTHGGRLPSAAEWHVAAANFPLTATTGNWEWLSDSVGETSAYDNHAAVGNTGITDFSWGYDTSSHFYRCFVPF